jgi:hypothetical protein
MPCPLPPHRGIIISSFTKLGKFNNINGWSAWELLRCDVVLYCAVSCCVVLLSCTLYICRWRNGLTARHSGDINKPSLATRFQTATSLFNTPDEGIEDPDLNKKKPGKRLHDIATDIYICIGTLTGVNHSQQASRISRILDEAGN